MPRKPTGKVIKNRAEVPQKNGDIYIYEREYQYNPKIKKTKRISNKLVAKVPKGMSEEVSTRVKRTSKGISLVGSQYNDLVDSNIYASRQHTGLTDILNHVGNISGIDGALFASTDKGTALKIMST